MIFSLQKLSSSMSGNARQRRTARRTFERDDEFGLRLRRIFEDVRGGIPVIEDSYAEPDRLCTIAYGYVLVHPSRMAEFKRRVQEGPETPDKES